ncbi:hypothetical protein EI94DRAFT_47325 [Lactarius quietus]|nr:hypothetical protein EI94DRAFT_47325 [Lactarius quietus]
MADAECPICINSFNFEQMRSLYCGHTYCSSCIEQIIDTRVLKCPECRLSFAPGQLRRLFITPSPVNNRSAAQAIPDSVEEDGFIKQATHIASRLGKMDPDTPAQSLKTAVDIMEHVATIQSKRAQEILWKAVREFWIVLVPFFEEWQEIRVLPGQVSDLKQNITELDQRCAALELVAENESKQRQQHTKKLLAKEREIAELQTVLHNANQRNTEERERYRVLLARHSASETKYRAQVKQLKKELKTRERESLTAKPQLEEESLVIEPDMPYDEARSHRLDIYNDAEGSHHHKLRTQNSDDHFSADEIDSLSSFPSSTQPGSQKQERGRGQAKRSHRNIESSPSPSLRRPRFGSDWELPRLRPRKLVESEPLPSN